MYLLQLMQNERKTILGIFESLESAENFVKKIPGYQRKEETIDDFVYVNEWLEVKDLPDYIEIKHNGNLVPLTRFMFPDKEDVEIYVSEVPNLDKAGSGLIEGATLVDAYVINNYETKDYVERREAQYKRVQAIMKEKGYHVERSFQGSEDGEAIVYCRTKEKSTDSGQEDWHFLMHMDPSFVEDERLKEEELETLLEEMLTTY